MKNSSFLKFIFCLICLVLLFKTSFSKIKLKTKDINQCKNFEHKKSDFKIDLFLGVWYPVKKSKDLPILDDCDKITIKNTPTLLAELQSHKRGAISTSRDTKRLDLGSTNNINSFKFSIMGINNVLTIIDTDYVSWALVYICSEKSSNRTYNALILSRNYTLDKRNEDVLENRSKVNLDIKIGEDLDQGTRKCAY
jgi:hypothetical protein